MKKKIALFCNVSEDAVITAKDVESIYEVPLALSAEGIDEIIMKLLDLPYRRRNLKDWEDLVRVIDSPPDEVTIGIVGKYVAYEDSYKSLREALLHGGVASRLKVNLRWIEAEDMVNGRLESELAAVDGILIPGGFGIRGVAGMVEAIRYARERRVPFFGICLGLQVASIEFARNVCGLAGANSTEFDRATADPVIDFMPDQREQTRMGGTMRLGSYRCVLDPESAAARAYGASEVRERHRHRYEFNNAYRDVFRGHGVRIAGLNPERDLVEIWELPAHPWFVCVQFHPELRSRPSRPHPLFGDFIRASLERGAPNGAHRSEVALGSPQ
jgi:CTP synthase